MELKYQYFLKTVQMIWIGQNWKLLCWKLLLLWFCCFLFFGAGFFSVSTVAALIGFLQSRSFSWYMYLKGFQKEMGINWHLIYDQISWMVCQSFQTKNFILIFWWNMLSEWNKKNFCSKFCSFFPWMCQSELVTSLFNSKMRE